MTCMWVVAVRTSRLTLATGGNFEQLDVDGTPAVTTINDDTDNVLISIVGPSTVTEGDTTTDYTVSLTDTGGNPINTVNPVSVALTYTGTAIDGAEFTGTINVVIGSCASSGTFNIATLIDATAEGAESFTVTLGTVTGGAEFENLIVDTANDEVTTTIADIDSAVLTVNDIVVNEGSGTATFTVTLSQAVAGGFSVDYTLGGGTATGGGT